MKTNHVKERLLAGSPSIGTWLAVPSPYLAEQIAYTGVDWLVCDAEHNPMSIDVLSNMFIAMAGTPAAPMVRIPWNDPENAKRVLDSGAWGVVFPMVCTKEEAEAAVAAVKYPPLGERSVGGGRHKISLDADSEKDYTGKANDFTMVIVQIEHVKAIENLDEILSVPGIDCCYIGPNDLLASMGQRPQGESDYPPFVEAVQRVVDLSRKHGVAPGMHVYNVEQMNRRIAQGFRFLALSSEMGIVTSTIKSDLAKVNWKK